MNARNTLILLVGSNPLPNYLAACALRPNHIALVHTKETVEAKERLRRAIGETLGSDVTFVDPDPLVEDATCATKVRRTLDPLLAKTADGNVLLNYTGGTKVMAVHACRAFKVNGKDEHASYLDEGGRDHQPRLRFDDGTPKELSEFPNTRLTLKTVLALHGLNHTPRLPKDPPPTSSDARELLHKVLADVPLASALHCEHDRLKEFKNAAKQEALAEPFRADRYGLTLSQPTFPTSEQLGQLANAKAKESWFKQWYKFIGGEWLEEWTGDQIRALAPDLAIDCDRDLTVGVNASREQAKEGDPPMEIDIAVVRGQRAYFISCTTDTSKGLCKSKLFEIAVRARQLGGDLARAALVCLAEDKIIQQLRHDIDDRQDADVAIRVPGVADVRVFGVSDVRTWSDYGDKPPNRDSLKKWLES